MQRDKQADIRQHSRGDRLAYDRVRDISLFLFPRLFVYPENARFVSTSRSFLLPSEDEADDRSCQDDRRCSDKQPFKCVERHAENGSFRIMKVPAQIRAAAEEQGRKDHCDHYA